MRLHTGSLWLDLFQNSRNIVFCKDLTFSGTSDLKRHQEDHKVLEKANKGCKGHFRGQRVKKWKNIDFIAFLCSFGVKNEEDSVF